MPDLAHYRGVVERLGNVYQCGEKLRCHCPCKDRHRRGDQNPSCMVWVGERGELVARCYSCGADWRTIARYLDCPESLFFPDLGEGLRKETKVQPKLVAEYSYTLCGRHVATKQRWEPGWQGAKKTFCWLRPVSDEHRRALKIPPAVHAFVKTLKGGMYEVSQRTQDRWYLTAAAEPSERTVQVKELTLGELLYREELLPKDLTAPVVVVEGEKDADRLAKLGFATVCPAGGASTWSLYHADALRERRVVIIADNNTVGEMHAGRIAGSLMLTATSVRLVSVHTTKTYRPPPDGGMGNYLDGLNLDATSAAREAVIAAVKEAPEWRPSST